MPSATLRAARQHFKTGTRLLESPVVAPAWALPVAGRQLEALRNLSLAAGDVADVGATAAADVRTALVKTDGGRADRVGFLRTMASVADQAHARLTRVPLGSTPSLLGPIRRRDDTFRTQLTQLLDGLQRGGAASAAMADLLQGPHKYLLLGANNAEMRSGSGMFLTAGVLETANGEVHVRDVQQTAFLSVAGDGVPYDGDMAARWGFAHPNREWRNLGLSPDFPDNAALAVRMWQAQRGEKLDGAIAVDAVAFTDLLAYSGPVTGPNGPINADNGLRYLLHDQYLAGDPLSPQRHEAVGDIASQVLGVINSGHVSFDMARDLSRAVDGRHILVWSADATQQDRWRQAGVDGALRSDDVVVAVANRGANKLDQFLDVGVRVETSRSAAGTDVALHLSLHNTAPTGEPPYISGYAPELHLPDGTYSGILAVNVPGASTHVSIDGTDTYAAAGPEGPTDVVAVPVVLARDSSQTVVVRFTLPPGIRRLRVVPSARVPRVSWTVGSANFLDDRARILQIGG